jgi:hypothetical protein
MTDEKDFVSKADLDVFLASLKQEIAKRDDAMLKEFDVRENKIHSSYAKKMKAVDKTASEEDVVDDSPSRRPTKRELELQSSMEKLVKELEDNKIRASAAERFKKVNESYLKNGINPKAVDMLYKIHSADQAFTEDEIGNLMMKVSVDGGAQVSLPIEKAMTYFTKSEQGQLFMAPKGAAGSGAKSQTATTNNGTSNNKQSDVPLYQQVIGKDFQTTPEVDWNSVRDSMKQ